MQFFHVSITFVAQELFSWRLVEKNWIFKKWKNNDFFVFWKRTRIDLQGPIMLESHQDVKTRHLVCICGGKSNIWHLYTFDSFSSLIRQNEILKFLEKSVFFNEENTNELAILLKSGKIHFFNLSCNHEFLGYESYRYLKKLNFFSIFRIFKFWSILTTFDLVLIDHFWPSFE